MSKRNHRRKTVPKTSKENKSKSKSEKIELNMLEQESCKSIVKTKDIRENNKIWQKVIPFMWSETKQRNLYKKVIKKYLDENTSKKIEKELKLSEELAITKANYEGYKMFNSSINSIVTLTISILTFCIVNIIKPLLDVKESLLFMFEFMLLVCIAIIIIELFYTLYRQNKTAEYVIVSQALSDIKDIYKC